MSLQKGGLLVNEKENKKSLKYLLGMALNHIRNYSGLSFVVILLMVIATICLLIATSPMINLERTLAHVLVDNEHKYISIAQNDYDDYQTLMRDEDFNTQYDQLHIINDFYEINSKDDVLNMGMNFHVVEEITDESIYLTDFMFEQLLLVGFEYSDDNVHFIDIQRYSNSTEDFSYEQFIGKYVRYDYLLPINGTFKIGGIIQTDYQQYYQDPFDDDYCYEIKNYNMDELYTRIFATKEFILTHNYFTEFYASDYAVTLNHLLNPMIEDDESLRIYTDEDAFYIADYYDFITAEGLYSGSEITLATNEILITAETYEKLFHEMVTYEDYFVYDEVLDKDVIYQLPTQLNTSITLSIKDLDNNDAIIDQQTFIIKGVSINNYIKKYNYNYPIIMHREDINDALDRIYRSRQALIELPSTETEVYALLKTLSAYDVDLIAPFYTSINVIGTEGTQYIIVFVAAFILMAILASSLALHQGHLHDLVIQKYYVQNQFNKREIITIKILAYSSLSIISMIISIVLSLIFIPIYGDWMSNHYYNSYIYSYMHFNLMTIVWIACVTLFMILLASIIFFVKSSSSVNDTHTKHH